MMSKPFTAKFNPHFTDHVFKPVAFTFNLYWWYLFFFTIFHFKLSPVRNYNNSFNQTRISAGFSKFFFWLAG